MTTPPAGPQEDEMWWRCRCHDVVLGECPNRDKIAAALSGTAVRGGAPAALREAATEVLAADSAFARDLDGADQRWDAALEGLRLALSENTVDSLDPERLAEAYGMVMALAPDPYPTATRWQAIASIYARLAAPSDASEEET